MMAKHASIVNAGFFYYFLLHFQKWPLLSALSRMAQRVITSAQHIVVLRIGPCQQVRPTWHSSALNRLTLRLYSRTQPFFRGPSVDRLSRRISAGAKTHNLSVSLINTEVSTIMSGAEPWHVRLACRLQVGQFPLVVPSTGQKEEPACVASLSPTHPYAPKSTVFSWDLSLKVSSPLSPSFYRLNLIYLLIF